MRVIARRLRLTSSTKEVATMWQSEAVVEISAPPDVVYQRLADFERHSDFSKGLARVEKITTGPVGVGSQFKALETVPSRYSSYSEITALEAPRRIAWKAWMPNMMRTEWEYLLTPHAGGTHLVQRTQFSGASLVGSLVLHLVRRRQVPRENQATLESIKVALEKEVVVS